jgi:hypothetical protein
MLIIPGLGLSLPMMIRGILTFIDSLSDGYSGWSNDHILFYIPLIYLIGDVIPLSF